MSDYKVGAYIRLSKEDERNRESESVINQRNFIKEYLLHHGLLLKEEYIDDGFTGTSFDRPSFKRLINDIERNEINMVITKDLSRLGRDYIKSGYYIEEYFPNKGVRYVSILDNVDTFKDSSSNDIAPFKALFNDMVSRDISKKIKSILECKKKEGLYLSSKAPYGYKKSDDDKYKLVVNRKESIVVKEIFSLFLKGKTITEISDYLNVKKVLSPNGKKWSYNSVYYILKNKVYLGISVQNVWTTISYKNRRRIKKSPEDWIVKEDNHTPLIGVQTFNKVQNKFKNKTATPLKKRAKFLLEGMIYCQDCGHLMGINRKGNNVFLVCNGYKKNSKSCTSHYINYKKLENEIILKLKKYIWNDKISIDNSNKIAVLKKKIGLLYMDRLSNLISLDEYRNMRKVLEEKICFLRKEEKINISRELLFSLIKQITVDKNRNICVEYRFKNENY